MIPEENLVASIIARRFHAACAVRIADYTRWDPYFDSMTSRPIDRIRDALRWQSNLIAKLVLREEPTR